MNKRPQWKYVASIYLKRKHVLVFRDNEIQVQLQVFSRIHGDKSKTDKLYFMDGGAVVFRSEDALIAAREDNPEPIRPGVHRLLVECIARKPDMRESIVVTEPRYPSAWEQLIRLAGSLLIRLQSIMKTSLPAPQSLVPPTSK